MGAKKDFRPGEQDGTTPPILATKPLTLTLLAHKLGVSRMSLFNWSKRPDAPKGTEYEEWLPYIQKNDLGRVVVHATGSLRDEKTKHEIELLKAKIAKEHRRVIDREEVTRLLLHIATRSRSMLYQFLETEAPPKLDGMSAATMRPILREMADAICDMQADLVRQFESQ